MSNQIGSLKMGQKFKKTPAGEIPVDWGVATISDLCQINPEVIKESTPPETQLKYIDIAAIERTGNVSVIKLIEFKTAPSRARRIVKAGDIIVSTVRPYLKAFARITDLSENLIASTGFAVLRARPNVNGGYVYQHVLSDSFVKYLEEKMTGSSYPAVNSSDVAEYQMPVPTAPEQENIGRILSDVDTLIDKVGAEIKKTKELKKSLMRQLLTRGIGHKSFKKTEFGEIPADWSVATFQEVFDFLRTANNSREDLGSDGEVGYIHYGDIHTKWRTKLDCDAVDLPRIDKAKVEGIPFLQNGDLVLADASEDYDGIGVSVEVSNITDQRIVAGLHTMLLRDRARRFIDGFRGYIQYVPIVRQGLIKAGTGVSVYSISKGNLRDIHISIPPLPEQRKITAILQGLGETIERAEEKLDKTVDLKTSLMNMLLTGKVRV